MKEHKNPITLLLALFFSVCRSVKIENEAIELAERELRVNANIKAVSTKYSLQKAKNVNKITICLAYRFIEFVVVCHSSSVCSLFPFFSLLCRENIKLENRQEYANTHTLSYTQCHLSSTFGADNISTKNRKTKKLERM